LVFATTEFYLYSTPSVLSGTLRFFNEIGFLLIKKKKKKRHKCNIFHTTALRVLPAFHQQANRSTTHVGITQNNTKHLKKIF